jgi:hypothetical protein
MKAGGSVEAGSSNSSGAIAPFSLEELRLPPVLTNVRPRMQLGILRLLFRRAEKKASCIWFSACKPCIQGNTCSGFGNGWVDICSNASAIRSAVMVYTGGSSEYSVQYVSGGYVIDEVSTRLSCRGGDAGGVAGRPPGEQNGMCLLGITAGVPRVDVLRDRCCGGVGDRVGTGSALATAAAMLAVERGRWGAVEGTQREQSTRQMANEARTMDENVGQKSDVWRKGAQSLVLCRSAQGEGQRRKELSRPPALCRRSEFTAWRRASC